MRKLLLRLGAAATIAALLLLGGAAWLLRSLGTPDLQAAILARTRATLGTDVQVTKMDVSVFSGVTLSGVTIANPAPFAGDLLSASSFVLRYRLWPLLSGRFEVERAAFAKPQLNLATDRKGRFNYESLGPPGGRPAVPVTGAPASRRSLPVDLRLKSITVEDGTILMRDAARAVVMKAEGVDLDADFELSGEGIAGAGRAAVARLNLADTLFVTGLSSPLRASRNALRLAPLRGRLAEGTVSGDVDVDLRRFGYRASLDLADASVAALLAQAGASRAMTGRLAGKASFEGAGGLATLKGSGRADVAACRLENARVLALLARVLRLPELANPDFDSCSAEFILAGSRLHTPVLRLEGRQLQLRGNGTLNLQTSALDYDMTLALAQPILNRLTVPELRAAFRDRGDGFSSVDFRVTGTTQQPQTDLAGKVGRAAAVEAIRGGLSRLFGRGKR